MGSGSGWNLWVQLAEGECGWKQWVWLVGIVVRRYIHICREIFLHYLSLLLL